MMGQSCVAGEIVDCLLPRPAVAVQPRVDHKPRSAPHVVALLAEALVGCPVDAHLDAEIFAIEAPAFAIAREVDVAPEARQRLALARNRGLKAVAGRAF